MTVPDTPMAPDGGPWLLLSAKGMNADTADDYTCDYPGCDKRATTYLFLGSQACCPEHLCERIWLGDDAGG